MIDVAFQPDLLDAKDTLRLYAYNPMRGKRGKTHVQLEDGVIPCNFRSKWYDGGQDMLTWDGKIGVWHLNRHKGEGRGYSPTAIDIPKTITYKTCMRYLNRQLERVPGKTDMTK